MISVFPFNGPTAP